MQFEGTVIKEQGITFAIVIVKPHVIQNSSTREEARDSFSYHFPNMPIILIAQNSSGRPEYHGRTDIVKFLANIDFHRIPWRKYTVN